MIFQFQITQFPMPFCSSSYHSARISLPAISEQRLFEHEFLFLSSPFLSFSFFFLSDFIMDQMAILIPIEAIES